MGSGEDAQVRVLDAARAELARSRFFEALESAELPRDAGLAWLRAQHGLAWRLNRAALATKAPELRTLRDRLRARTAYLNDTLRPFDEFPAFPFPAGPLSELLLALEGAESAMVIAVGVSLDLMAERPLRLDGQRVGWGRARRGREPEGPLGEQTLDALAQTTRNVVALAHGLHPPAPIPTTASALNRDAGRHYITQDPRELAAALDAGARTWDAYPYYEARFGERGRRFTRSDSAWLASLGQDPTVEQQLEWLAGVLAARGMPTLLLETHLRHLHEALMDILPHRGAAYRWLPERAECLQRRRHDILSSRSLGRLAAGFGPPEPPFEGMGRIVVAAVADQAAGYPRALDSVLGWARDAARFDGTWVSAVENLVRAAERSVRRRKTSDRQR